MAISAPTSVGVPHPVSGEVLVSCGLDDTAWEEPRPSRLGSVTSYQLRVTRDRRLVARNSWPVTRRFVLDESTQRRDDASGQNRGSPLARARTDDRPPDGGPMVQHDVPEGRGWFECSPYPALTPAPSGMRCGTPGDGRHSSVGGPGRAEIPRQRSPASWPGSLFAERHN